MSARTPASDLSPSTYSTPTVYSIERQQQTRRHGRQEEPEEIISQAPRFVSQFSENVHLDEGESARFECRFEPIHDPNLQVQWLYNGKPVPAGNHYPFTDLTLRISYTI